MRLVFKDGGAFDFQTILERVKERVMQAREEGISVQDATLEDLPAYEDAGAPPPGFQQSQGQSQGQGEVPADPPPGYEEAQCESVSNGISRKV